MAHPRVVVVGSLLLAVVLAGGAAVALTNATDDKGSSTAAPSPAPLQTAPPVVPEQTPTPTSPAPVVTASATPSPTATATVTPKATPSATPAAPVTHYAYPAPTRSSTPLYLADVGYDPDGDSTHPAPYLKAHAIDGDGTIRLGRIDWGDGTVTQGTGAPGACAPRPSPTTRPGPYTPHRDEVTYVKDHTYTLPGTYRISVTVDSGNADCRPHGPATETATLSLTVTV